MNVQTPLIHAIQNVRYNVNFQVDKSYHILATMKATTTYWALYFIQTFMDLYSLSAKYACLFWTSFTESKNNQ